MIDKEIEIIINDVIFHTKEILKFLRSIEKTNTNTYLQDLVNYTLCTEEDIKIIKNYIFKLELKLYELSNGGDNFEK